MNWAILTGICAFSIFISGCVNTVDGRRRAGVPFTKDRVEGLYPRTTQEIWSATPNKTIWEERFFLPTGDFGYIRPVLYSEAGGYRTLGNPIFLVSENPAEGELPLTDDRSDPSAELLEMGGMLEASTGLPEDAQARILREFLADATTRYGTCWLLQNRTDIISDRVLADLALTDTSPQVQLGAAYALVVRGSDVAPDILPLAITSCVGVAGQRGKQLIRP